MARASDKYRPLGTPEHRSARLTVPAALRHRPDDEYGATTHAEAPARGNGFLHPVAVPRDDPRDPLPPLPKAWQFLCLAEIANFSALRRHLGRSRANRLAIDVSGRINASLANARISVIGRDMVEIGFEGDSLTDLAAALGCLTADFDLPLDLDGEQHRLRMHFGAAAAPFAHAEEVRLSEEAESALDQARSEAHAVIRDLSAGTPAFDRLTLTRELPSAILNGEMFLQYQPKVHVRRQEIASAEALVRWQHPPAA